jgi:hypothetical protein
MNFLSDFASVPDFPSDLGVAGLSSASSSHGKRFDFPARVCILSPAKQGSVPRNPHRPLSYSLSERRSLPRKNQ